MFWGFRYECFYSNVDISQSTTLPKGKPNVNSGLFKGLNEVKSYFWQAVLKTRIDNNRADRKVPVDKCNMSKSIFLSKCM